MRTEDFVDFVKTGAAVDRPPEREEGRAWKLVLSNLEGELAKYGYRLHILEDMPSYAAQDEVNKVIYLAMRRRGVPVSLEDRAWSGYHDLGHVVDARTDEEYLRDFRPTIHLEMACDKFGLDQTIALFERHGVAHSLHPQLWKERRYSTPQHTAEWLQNLGKGRGFTELDQEQVHAIADHLGVEWDNSPAFMADCQRAVGKQHLDDMDRPELWAVVQMMVRQVLGGHEKMAGKPRYLRERDPSTLKRPAEPKWRPGEPSRQDMQTWKRLEYLDSLDLEKKVREGGDRSQLRHSRHLLKNRAGPVEHRHRKLHELLQEKVRTGRPTEELDWHQQTLKNQRYHRDVVRPARRAGVSPVAFQKQRDAAAAKVKQEAAAKSAPAAKQVAAKVVASRPAPAAAPAAKQVAEKVVASRPTPAPTPTSAPPSAARGWRPTGRQVAIGGAAVGATALAGYGVHRLLRARRERHAREAAMQKQAFGFIRAKGGISNAPTEQYRGSPMHRAWSALRRGRTAAADAGQDQRMVHAPAALQQQIRRFGSPQGAAQVESGGKIFKLPKPPAPPKPPGQAKTAAVKITSPPKRNRKEFPYQGTCTFQGIKINIENKRGSVRKGKGPKGKEWRTVMPHHYGEVPRSLGADGDPVDVYVGPNEKSDIVYIVHQMKAPGFKVFDEDKVMLGFTSAKEAKREYLRAYDNPKFFGSLSACSVEDFKKALRNRSVRGKRISTALVMAKVAKGRKKALTAQERFVLSRTPRKKEASELLAKTRWRDRPKVLREHLEKAIPQHLPEHTKLHKVETYRGLGFMSPKATIHLRTDGDKNPFQEDDHAFSYGTADLTLKKKLLRGKWHVEADSMYLKPEFRRRGIGAAGMKGIAQAGKSLGATHVGAEADDQGKAVWAKTPGIRFGSRAERRRIRKEHNRGAAKDGKPLLGKDFRPSDVPSEFLHKYQPSSMFLRYHLPLQKKAAVHPSKIHGKGFFTDEPVKKGKPIAVAFDERGMQSPEGRKTNHSYEPNAEIKKKGKARYLVALRELEAGEEVTVDYRKIYIPERGLVGVAPKKGLAKDKTGRGILPKQMDTNANKLLKSVRRQGRPKPIRYKKRQGWARKGT